MITILQEYSVWNNTGLDYVYALGVFVGALNLFYVFRRILLRKIKHISTRTRSELDDVLVEITQNIAKFSYTTVAIFIAIHLLSVSDFVGNIAYAGFIFVLVFEVSKAVEKIIAFAVKHHTQGNDLVGEGADQELIATQNKAVASIFRVAARMIVWSLGLLLLLQNLGVEVTSLIAGLGIGGVAVALALQNVLGDLFSAVTIYLDKPFEIGDFIIVGDFLGTIEKVGIKSTRVRSLSGEQVVFSNNDLLGARVRNYKRMYERRVVFKFGVLYETHPDILEKIPKWIQEIVTLNEKVRFDRAHFVSFGDSSLDFEVVYYVIDPDYNLYMDIQQSVNLAIMRKFSNEGITFAYPTRTVRISRKDSGRFLSDKPHGEHIDS